MGLARTGPDGRLAFRQNQALQQVDDYSHLTLVQNYWSDQILIVEKTDRLYRNLRDAVTLEDLDIEIHLVKEGQIISRR